jgi:hypothetical protein
MADKRDVPIFRLRKVLREQMQGRKNYSRLAKRIKDANEGAPGQEVDRRKLKRLLEGDDVALSLNELIALDAFLTPLGEGLADKPLFERPATIRSLVDKNQVTIVLGAYARTEDRRNDLSRWDVRSMAHLLSTIETLKPGTHVDIRDVLSEGRKPEPLPYLAESGPSVCCIGSPRASHATEIMLAEMFGVKPFGENQLVRAPIRFIWSQNIKSRLPSSFRVASDEIRDADPQLADAIDSEKARGTLQVNEKLYPDWSGTGRTTWRSHGIVAVQARAGGQVWMVCAGVTGPSTYASTVAVACELTGTVPEARSGHSPVRWDIVECTVETDPELNGDKRVVTSRRVVNQGCWPPAKSNAPSIR